MGHMDSKRVAHSGDDSASSASTTPTTAATSQAKSPDPHQVPCERTACKSSKNAFRMMMHNQQPTSATSAAPAHASTPRAATCPPDREDIGRAGWTLLHTIAAYYPQTPTEQDKTDARALIRGFAHLYPCGECASAFELDVEDNPPRLETREAFSVWICEQHNVVNEKLGKPTSRCNIAELDKRWRFNPSCEE
eukprot:c1478_g1_i1.p1 GENE.c1478_g1_i1~~c1478_g1_i1.p1  ORF type:complete len:193 (-),score=34.63 c1478_g1_i1:247-825(-)